MIRGNRSGRKQKVVFEVFGILHTGLIYAGYGEFLKETYLLNKKKLT